MSMFTQSFGQQAGSTLGEQIVLISMDVYPTRDYHNMHRRSYTCQLTGPTMEKLGSMIDRMGANKAFSSMGIGELNASYGAINSGLDSGGIIRYSASPTGSVEIANGWQTQRVRFTLSVDVYVAGQRHRRETVSGYSDYHGVSLMTSNPKFDPSMTYVIDSIKTEPYEQRSGLVGMQTAANIGATSTLLASNPSTFSNPFVQSSDTTYLARPVDVFTVSDALSMIDGANDSLGLGSFDTNTGVMQINGRSFISDATVTSAAKCSNQKNDMPTTYASRVFTNFYNTAYTANSQVSDDFLSPATQAMIRVKETNVTDSSFAFSMRNIGSACSVTGVFTHAELLRLDPSFDSRISYDPMGELVGANNSILIPPTSVTANLGTTGHSQIIAHMVANTFLTLMGTHGLSICSANCDNYSGVPRCVITGEHGFTADNRQIMADNFQNQMVSEVLSMIHNSGIGSFYIRIMADVTNQIYLSVQLNGELQPTEFVLPAFARAALTPVVTNNFDMLTTFATDLNSVVNSVINRNEPKFEITGSSGFSTGGGYTSGGAANW